MAGNATGRMGIFLPLARSARAGYSRTRSEALDQQGAHDAVPPPASFQFAERQPSARRQLDQGQPKPPSGSSEAVLVGDGVLLFVGVRDCTGTGMCTVAVERGPDCGDLVTVLVTVFVTVFVMDSVTVGVGRSSSSFFDDSALMA
jgi:hypothetical protein